MKGRGRVKRFSPDWFLIDPAASWMRTRADEAPGSTSGEEPAGGSGVDAGGVWRILERGVYVRCLPSLRGWLCHRSVGRPAIHSAISAH